MDRSLQVPVPAALYRAAEAAASARGVAVATVVSEAIAHYLDAGPDRARAAADRVLAAAPMDVPDLEQLGQELDELRGRRG